MTAGFHCLQQFISLISLPHIIQLFNSSTAFSWASLVFATFASACSILNSSVCSLLLLILAISLSSSIFNRQSLQDLSDLFRLIPYISFIQSKSIQDRFLCCCDCMIQTVNTIKLSYHYDLFQFF